MLPNYSIHEYLVFERHRQLQREMAELRLLAGLPRRHSSLLSCIAGKLGVLLVVLGTRLQQLEPSGKHLVGQSAIGLL